MIRSLAQPIIFLRRRHDFLIKLGERKEKEKKLIGA